MDLTRQIASIVAVFALLGLALWALRRGGNGFSLRTAVKLKTLEPVERLILTPNHTLHLVRIGERDLLVATHPQGCTVLLESNRGSAT